MFRGFPNLFQIVGPNTALGHSSMIFIIESQVRYVVEAAKANGFVADALRRHHVTSAAVAPPGPGDDA